MNSWIHNFLIHTRCLHCLVQSAGQINLKREKMYNSFMHLHVLFYYPFSSSLDLCFLGKRKWPYVYYNIHCIVFFSLFKVKIMTIQRRLKKKILFQIYLIFWILYIQHGTNEENEAISNCQLQMSGSQILKGWPIWQRRNCYTWQVWYMNSIGEHNDVQRLLEDADP